MADLNRMAYRIVQEATGQEPKTAPPASNRGTAGGTARATKLTPERRSEIARTAAQTRWARKEKRAEKAEKRAKRAKRAARPTKSV